MIVCHCHVVNDRVIRELIDDDATSADEIARRCGAGDGCGGCIDTIATLLAQQRGAAVAVR